MSNNIIDYTASFPHSILAQGKNNNLLMLDKLDTPRRRADGKLAHYILEYRWLSRTCEQENDQSWACTLGSDYIRPTASETRNIREKIKNHKHVSLFDHFHLY